MNKRCFFILIIFATLSINKVQAAANVTITPQRVVLESSLRSQALTLLNTGNSLAEFRIKIDPVIINEAGRYEKVKEPDNEQIAIKKLFRVSPRKVILKPGESQLIRVASRKPANLPDGEYMAALTVLPKDIESNNSAIKKTTPRPTLSTVEVKMQVSVTIPLILRQGDLTASVKIEDVNFASDKSGQTLINVSLAREGQRSVNAYMEAHIERGGRKQKIGQSWFVMYPPKTSGSGRIPVKLPEKFDTAGSKLIVSVVERQVGPHNGEVLGKAVFALQ